MSLEDDANELDVSDSTAQQEVATPSTPTPEEELEFKWNGKPVRGNREKILNWASQGYDYAQQISRLKAERESWEKDTSSLREIHQYAQQNPDWYKHWETAYSNRSMPTQQAQQPQNGDDLNASIKEQLQELTKFRDEFLSQRQKEQIEKEDNQIKEEIASIQKQYSNLNWDTLDDNGYDLTQRVLKYGSENDFKSFRAAFRDLMHDDIVKHHQSTQAETAAKNKQAEVKQGIVARSKEPLNRPMQSSRDFRKMSYEQLAEEAKRELRAKNM